MVIAGGAKMSEELIVHHCSPTLAGIKTGNLFTCKYTDKTALNQDIRTLNCKLVPKGLRVIPLQFFEDRVLIYLYRPRKLKKDLYGEQSASFLADQGYPVENADRCVAELSRRLSRNLEFPHEIGLFLGYPPEDVKGFIGDCAGRCKCVGYWKVYGDVQRAKKQFARYKKCTEIYCSRWANGKNIERLVIAD